MNNHVPRLGVRQRRVGDLDGVAENAPSVLPERPHVRLYALKRQRDRLVGHQHRQCVNLTGRQDGRVSGGRYDRDLTDIDLYHLEEGVEDLHLEGLDT